MIKTTHRAEDASPAAKPSGLKYQEETSPLFTFGERLARNLGLAGMILLAVTAVRNAKLPEGQTVLSAVQDMVEGDWDETLGKISFVSNMIPDSVSVFFQSDFSEPLSAPCSGLMTHGYTADEPYLCYQSGDGKVYAAAVGQVMSVAHGIDEERIVRIRHENGLETLYYNLAETFVTEGDEVTAAQCIGRALDDGVIMEVRRDGLTIDPGAVLTDRGTAAP